LGLLGFNQFAVRPALFVVSSGFSTISRIFMIFSIYTAEKRPSKRSVYKNNPNRIFIWPEINIIFKINAEKFKCLKKICSQNTAKILSDRGEV